ncbi:unnamed protein product [Mytilus coruscus]|uniref:Uncharacterized protein n=1 Tax=Mytilus coruscus TaxID=42192 RepID=A0A6J8BBN4_MYTCO|nr:unnamed protein product [Mytilus coruscus]
MNPHSDRFYKRLRPSTPNLATLQRFILPHYRNLKISWAFIFYIATVESALEETCINGQPANQCSLQETECIPATSGSSDYKCLCQAGYYSDSPSCKQFSVETHSRPSRQTTSVAITDGCMVDLQVTNLDVPNDERGETYFLVTWTNPSTHNVTSRIPGRKYSISLVSVETHSRPSRQTTSVAITDGCTPQTPRDFACTDLNILDRSLTLTWKEPLLPNGDIKHYIVYDLNRSLQLQTNGSVLEQFIEELQPVATKPLNAEITGVTKDTISIRWDPPMFPGGQILAYRLTVKNITDSANEKCVQEIILQCNECVTQIEKIEKIKQLSKHFTENQLLGTSIVLKTMVNLIALKGIVVK